MDTALSCFPVEDVKEVFRIAEKCLELDPSERPTMAAVHKMLEQVNTFHTLISGTLKGGAAADNTLLTTGSGYTCNNRLS